MKTLKLVLVVTVMFCFVSSLSYAQNINKKGACRADIEKFCKDVQPGQGRLVQCVKQHEAELSPACKEQIDVDKEKARDFIKACKPDAEKLCKGVALGKGRIYRCLKANEAQLSPDCKTHFKK
ncbi:MAG: cysteine rich repeat-containing protein [Deltaproteobacteria bacterium]|nr:cysteine rich repeat-containing protein [Deltaproteobacteria bacterium]